MTEIQRADPVARRRALIAAVVIAMGGWAAFFVLQDWLAGLRGSDPARVRRALEGAMIWGSWVACLPVAALAVWLWRTGVRIARSGRYPPPGAKVIRDTPVVHGNAARLRATALKLLAIFLGYPHYYDLPGVKTLTLDILGMKLDIVFVIAVYVMLALGLNIVVGYAGLLDLGYVAFYALGAYTVGWFASDNFDQITFHLGSTATPGLPGIHLNFYLVILVAGVIAAIAGVIIGWPTLRLRGDYLAIVTLGFGEIIPDVFRNADQLPVPEGFRAAPPFIEFGTANLTDGVRGIRLLDKPGFGETISNATGGVLPDRFVVLVADPCPEAAAGLEQLLAAADRFALRSSSETVSITRIFTILICGLPRNSGSRNDIG